VVLGYPQQVAQNAFQAIPNMVLGTLTVHDQINVVAVVA